MIEFVYGYDSMEVVQKTYSGGERVLKFTVSDEQDSASHNLTKQDAVKLYFYLQKTLQEWGY